MYHEHQKGSFYQAEDPFYILKYTTALFRLTLKTCPPDWTSEKLG